MQKIDLGILTKKQVRSLSGHDRGTTARQHFGLDDLDTMPDAVVVTGPSNLDALTPSFVQGMFAGSVNRLGKSAFFEHYKFDLPTYLVADIQSGVERVLMSRELK